MRADFGPRRGARAGRSEDTIPIDIDALALPVIAVIPAMTTLGERRRSRRLQGLIVAATSAVVVPAAMAAVWRFQLLDNIHLLENWVP